MTQIILTFALVFVVTLIAYFLGYEHCRRATTQNRDSDGADAVPNRARKEAANPQSPIPNPQSKVSP